MGKDVDNTTEFMLAVQHLAALEDEARHVRADITRYLVEHPNVFNRYVKIDWTALKRFAKSS